MYFPDEHPIRRELFIPAGSGLFALNWEISVCVRLRGGAGSTRTSNQTIVSSWLLALRLACDRLVSQKGSNAGNIRRPSSHGKTLLLGKADCRLAELE